MIFIHFHISIPLPYNSLICGVAALIQIGGIIAINVIFNQ